MDAVYRQASLTIVAAAGNDADAGLAGVASTPRRQWQFVFGTNKWKFANQGDDLEEALRSSRWLTRGWTYQEFALSSRLLVFTDVKAFFVDAQRANSLDSSYLYQSESNLTRIRQRGSIASSFATHVVSKPLDAIGLYNNSVETYSIRELTFHDDILNAFEGIASYLNQGFRGGFTFALPNFVLDLGLLWHSYFTANSGSALRQGYPEYSWVSRKCKISMMGKPADTWPSSRVLWRNFYNAGHKQWICEDDLMPKPGSTEATRWVLVQSGSIIKDNSGKSIEVTQPYWEDKDEYPNWQHTKPILPKNQLPVLELAEPGFGRLHLLAHTIRLRLQQVGVEDSLWRANSRQLENEGRTHGQQDIEIGRFNMDRPGFINPIKLVLLCCFENHARMPYFERPQGDSHHCSHNNGALPGSSCDVSKFLRDAARVAKNPPNGLGRNYNYAVLAVETKDGISYRRGVGTMSIAWFHRADPVRRYVVLG
ncbi:hypothetical protein MMC10_009379 [Thelotrema lepadinum]|nr:hypothetical protein [Thelotrema lepadinum]